MNPSTFSRGTFKVSLSLVLATFLFHLSPGAGQTVQPAAPRPAVVQNSTAPMTAPVRATDPIKKTEPGRNQSAKPPTSQGAATDYGVFKLGGSVYSTGTEDVIVRVLNSALVCPVPRGHNWPDLSPFNNGLYLLSPGPARFIAFNTQAGTTINLGKLPPGELVFGLRVNEYNCYFQTGDISRNPDRLDHVSKRTFKSDDLVELWFEDALGPKGTGRSDRDFNDIVISVSGGIDNGAMADLAQSIQQQPAASREAVIAGLKKVDPKTAAAVSLQRSGPSN
jgi:hypothetical protein